MIFSRFFDVRVHFEKLFFYESCSLRINDPVNKLKLRYRL